MTIDDNFDPFNHSSVPANTEPTRDEFRAQLDMARVCAARDAERIKVLEGALMFARDELNMHGHTTVANMVNDKLNGKT